MLRRVGRELVTSLGAATGRKDARASRVGGYCFCHL